jgi:para-nitrobenzyl esterase
MLLASPLTKGLIHRAIMHSGAPMQAIRPYLRLDEMEQMGVVTAQLLNAPATNQIKYLRSLPASDIAPLVAKVRTRLMEINGQAYDEGTDGYAMSLPSNEVWSSHKELQIPIIIGSTAQDTAAAIAGEPGLDPKATPEEVLVWKKRILEIFYGKEPDLLQRALQIYGVTPGPNEISTYPPYGSPALQLGVDLNHRCATAMSVGLHSAIAPTWQFEFTMTSPGHPPSHTADVRYVFGYDELEDESARKRSDIMQQYWTNFAKTGDPNGPGLPAWSKYEGATKQSMEFTTDGPVLKPQPRQAACAPFIELYTRNPKLLSSGEKLRIRGTGGAQ